MGYRIGWQCFNSKEAATDYQMSQVIPAITADGKLLHPVKEKGKWLYQGQEVHPSFGECDIEKEVKDGMTVAATIVGLMVVAYGFRVLKTFIESMLYKDEKE